MHENWRKFGFYLISICWLEGPSSYLLRGSFQSANERHLLLSFCVRYKQNAANRRGALIVRTTIEKNATTWNFRRLMENAKTFSSTVAGCFGPIALDSLGNFRISMNAKRLVSYVLYSSMNMKILFVMASRRWWGGKFWCMQKIEQWIFYEFL